MKSKRHSSASRSRLRSGKKLRKLAHPKKKSLLKRKQAKKHVKPKNIGAASRLLNQYGDNLSDLVYSIKEMQKLEAKTGKSYADLTREYEAMTVAERKLSESVQAMEKRRDDLSQEIAQLEDLSDLQSLLRENNVDTKLLLEFMTEQRKLDKLGFNSSAIRLVASELKVRGMDPAELASKIQRFAPKATSLEQVLSLLEQRIAETRKEETTALARLDALNSQAEEVKAGILALKDHLAYQSRELEREYEIRRRVLDSQIQEERTRRELETIELLKLRDKTAGAVQALKEEEQEINEKISKNDASEKN